MSFFHKKSKADTALKYFHKPPGYYNCAQAVFKAFQDEFQVSNEQISDFSKFGNGKAKDGHCGAYCAGMELLKNHTELSEKFSHLFKEKSEYLTCFDIRFNYTMSCKNLVRLSANLLEELCTNKEIK